ncbi:MAG: helix-turn-helix transcriptional regulator [Bacteroidia bacterium]
MNSKEQLKYLKNLSKNIKKIRKEKGLTQADCNVDERTIRRIENENFNPSLLTLIQIAKGLDVTLTELLNMD